MKYLIILLSLLADKSCTESKINQDNISIEYTASSRNMYKKIVINNKTISKTDKRGGKLISTDCSEANWNKIIETLKTLDVKNIPNLESPSRKFLFDGAALANLKITYNNTIYKTNPFDHGNPHKKIELLIQDILSIAQNIE